MTAEATYHLDPDTHRLRLVEYRDFVTETVRSLFPDPTELRSKWASRSGARTSSTRSARTASTPPSSSSARACSTPTRSTCSSTSHGTSPSPHVPTVPVVCARSTLTSSRLPAGRPQVLGYLLDKYAEHGISELDDLGVLQVPPLSSLGTPVEIAKWFGSADALKAAMSRLSELVYVA